MEDSEKTLSQELLSGVRVEQSENLFESIK